MNRHPLTVSRKASLKVIASYRSLLSQSEGRSALFNIDRPTNSGRWFITRDTPLTKSGNVMNINHPANQS